MPQIILSSEQARVIRTAQEPVQVCDDHGAVVGYLRPLLTKEELEEIRRRMTSDEPRYTTAQVLAYLESLGK